MHDDLVIRLVLHHAAHERSLDFQIIGTKLVEKIIRRVAAAEVIERELAAERAQLLDVLAQRFAQRNRFALGDFDRDRAAGFARGLEQGAEILDEAAIVERSQVYVQEQRLFGRRQGKRRADDV